MSLEEENELQHSQRRVLASASQRQAADGCVPCSPALEMVTQLDGGRILMPRLMIVAVVTSTILANSFSKVFQQTIIMAHGLIDCTAVIIYLQGKLGVINGPGINISTILN